MTLGRAIRDRARAASKATGRPANEIVRRFVYDRFLARVFADPSAPWVLKGRTAVLARVNDARHSKDVDLLSSLGDIDAALEVLRAAAAVDLADHFRFVIRTVRPSGGAAKQPDVAGYRVQVDAYCGTRRCEAFGVDLVTGSLMTTEPEVVRSSLPLEVPGLPPPTVRVYPVVDHIADKARRHPDRLHRRHPLQPPARPRRPRRARPHPARRRREGAQCDRRRAPASPPAGHRDLHRPAGLGHDLPTAGRQDTALRRPERPRSSGPPRRGVLGASDERCRRRAAMGTGRDAMVTLAPGGPHRPLRHLPARTRQVRLTPIRAADPLYRDTRGRR